MVQIARIKLTDEEIERRRKAYRTGKALKSELSAKEKRARSLDDMKNRIAERKEQRNSKEEEQAKKEEEDRQKEEKEKQKEEERIQKEEEQKQKEEERKRKAEERRAEIERKRLERKQKIREARLSKKKGSKKWLFILAFIIIIAIYIYLRFR